MNKYVVYELWCPIDNKVMYVGMSRNVHGRYRAHRKGDEKSTHSFVKKIKSLGLKPILKVVVWGLSKKEAFIYEHALTIFCIKNGTNLLNTYFGSVPNTKKEKIKLSYSKEKMAITRKIQCQSGAEKERLLAYNEKRKVSIIDHNGRVYSSMRECERITGCFRTSIKKVLNGEYSQTNGYFFKRVAQ